MLFLLDSAAGDLSIMCLTNEFILWMLKACLRDKERSGGHLAALALWTRITLTVISRECEEAAQKSENFFYYLWFLIFN